MDFVGKITPLRHVILMLQDPWLGFGWHQNAYIIVAGVMVVATLLSARFFRWNSLIVLPVYPSLLFSPTRPHLGDFLSHPDPPSPH